MAVVIETTLGDLTVDLFLEQRPRACLNFLKLCKMKYYNFNLFHSIQSSFLAQTGDPTGSGTGGESIWGIIEGQEKRYFSAERVPRIRHSDVGMLSMVCTGEDSMVGSQFFLTLGPDLDSLDATHCVIGVVTEGHDVLRQLNEVICDETNRPYRDVRITHTVVLEDPFDDPDGFHTPSRSPSPSAERLAGGRIAPDEEIDETKGKSLQEINEIIEEKEAKARATILEIVGDLPDADVAPPENVLFVCKLNPVTTDSDLEIIFSRFGKIVNCEIIRDKKTGDSLQYAFIEFEDQKSCESAYFKMDNVLIDDRRIHVDFSQSVSKIKYLGKGRGVKHFSEKESNENIALSRRSRSRDRQKRDYRQNFSNKKDKEQHQTEREKKRNKDDSRRTPDRNRHSRERERHRESTKSERDGDRNRREYEQQTSVQSKSRRDQEERYRDTRRDREERYNKNEREKRRSRSRSPNKVSHASRPRLNNSYEHHRTVQLEKNIENTAGSSRKNLMENSRVRTKSSEYQNPQDHKEKDQNLHSHSSKLVSNKREPNINTDDNSNVKNIIQNAQESRTKNPECTDKTLKHQNKKISDINRKISHKDEQLIKDSDKHKKSSSEKSVEEIKTYQKSKQDLHINNKEIQFDDKQETQSQSNKPHTQSSKKTPSKHYSHANDISTTDTNKSSDKSQETKLPKEPSTENKEEKKIKKSKNSESKKRKKFAKMEAKLKKLKKKLERERKRSTSSSSSTSSTSSSSSSSSGSDRKRKKSSKSRKRKYSTSSSSSSTSSSYDSDSSSSSSSSEEEVKRKKKIVNKTKVVTKSVKPVRKS